MKKNIALLLTLALSFTMLTGCSGGDHSKPKADAAAAETETKDDTDAATQSAPDTVILKETDESMINTYTLIAVNPDAPFADADGNAVSDVAINTEGADALIDWFLTQEALDLAADYGVAEYNDHLFYVKDDAPAYSGEITPAAEENKVIRLSTTTSVNDSGLLGYMLPTFEEKYGYTVEIQSAGTGKAIAAAQYGNADLILVHAKSQEEEIGRAHV